MLLPVHYHCHSIIVTLPNISIIIISIMIIFIIDTNTQTRHYYCRHYHYYRTPPPPPPPPPPTAPQTLVALSPKILSSLFITNSQRAHSGPALGDLIFLASATGAFLTAGISWLAFKTSTAFFVELQRPSSVQSLVGS